MPKTVKSAEDHHQRVEEVPPRSGLPGFAEKLLTQHKAKSNDLEDDKSLLREELRKKGQPSLTRRRRVSIRSSILKMKETRKLYFGRPGTSAAHR